MMSRLHVGQTRRSHIHREKKRASLYRRKRWTTFCRGNRVVTSIYTKSSLCAGRAYKKTARWIPAPFWIVEDGRVFYGKHRMLVWTFPCMQTVFLPSREPVTTQQIEGSRLTSLDSRYVLRISMQASSSTLSSITVCIP